MTKEIVETPGVLTIKREPTLRQILPPSESYTRTSLRRFFKSRLNQFALGVFLFITLISAAAPLISGNILNISPDYFRASFSPSYAPPFTTEALRNGKTVVHWLGTDELGRDMLARLLHAGGASISIGLLVTVIIMAVGVPLGLAAGYFGKWIDDACNAVIQVINSIPGLYLFLVLGGIFRPNIIFLALIFGLLNWTGTARQVRGLTLSLRNRDFVTASIAVGSTWPRILVLHLLPNIISILVVLVGTDIATAMLGEATLSFLGFGIRDPDVSWGKLLTNSSEYLTYAGNHNPFLIIGPGLLIFVTILSVYLIADGLRDAFDPTLKN